MKTKKTIVRTIIFFVILSSLLAITVFSVHLIKKVNNGFDDIIFEKNKTSVSKIFYYEYENRQDRIGVLRELTDEEIFLERSEWRSIYDLPENLKNAFIAVEDKRFYEHSGVDWLRTVKAALNHIFKFDKSGYGGSTITQQLIKNVTGENDFSVKRKIEEIIRAIKIEKKQSKSEILENYLNIVYMAENCYGVAAASRLYFEKDVSELTLAECAALASIVQNPAKYDPYKFPENNRQRRKIVLNAMLEQGMISKKEYNEAIEETVTISKDVESNRSSGVYSWYTEALLEEVASDLSKKYELNKGAARSLILRGGFEIYSVIDPKIQKSVEKVYENYMAYIDNQNGAFPQSSCVILDPYTSDILAIVGGTGKKTSNLVYNRATMSKRPPASVIKPLSVYAPGLEEKVFDYATAYDDAPIEEKNGAWWPKNSPDRYRGLMPISFAVSHSVNTVAVKALRDLGIQKSADYLKKFGITIDKERDYNESSLALGQLTYGTNLLNITNAYTAFSNGGYVSKPKTYLYVKDSTGNIILEKATEKKQVISKESAFIMTMILKNTVEEGTASSIRVKSMVEVAGKTGTSSNSQDKWFVGYSPFFTCGIWTGFDTPKPLSGQNPSCVLFDAIMQDIHRDIGEYAKFSKPENVVASEFCFDSGKKPCKRCLIDERGDRTRIGYFISGNLPSEECGVHKNVRVDESGKVIKGFWKLFGKKASLLDYSRQEHSEVKIMDEEQLLKNRLIKT